MIGQRELAAMRRDAILVNVSRGQLVDEAALAEALAGGVIGGAALDVFEREPLPPDSPLWSSPDILITPHTAGHGPHLDERRFEILLDNARRFLTERPLRNVVDKANWF